MRDSLEVQVWGSLILGTIHIYNGSKIAGFVFISMAIIGMLIDFAFSYSERKHRNE